MTIPFFSFKPQTSLLKKDYLKVFERFIEDEYYILGKSVQKFEEEYANFSNTKYCVGLSNGLDALHIALRALEIGEGDEIIVPSNTYIATWIAVSQVGATIVPVEPNIDYYNIDCDLIESKITSKTKAILPVHLCGQCCNMEKIMALAKKYSLYVIEDNAQAQGASFKQQLTGSFGDINATSFYPAKNLGALGDAGAVTLNNENHCSKVKSIRNYGSHKKYYNELIGYNMRLDECQAAILSTKLKYLNEWNKQRNEIADWYIENLNKCDKVILPKTEPDATHVYHLFVIRSEQRDELKTFLEMQGIGTLIHYPIPPHLQKAYQHLNYKIGDFPIAELLARTSLSLPIWPGMTKEMVDYVCDNIIKFYSK